VVKKNGGAVAASWVRRIFSCFFVVVKRPKLSSLVLFNQVEEDHTGYIHLDKFLPAMTKVLLDHKFPSIPEDLLLQTFEVRSASKGYLEPEELTKYMTQEGEVFTQEEMDEMLTALADHEKNLVYYKDLISQLTIDPDM
uniref:EF-hand calcium binding domain 2 n=1 Tax=Sander lucioperca TaxID=283035 RepID=A0A8C9XTL5_SANLU